MKVTSIFLITTLILSFQIIWGIEKGGHSQRGVYKENEILVKFKKGVSEERIEEINGRMGTELVKVIRTVRIHVLQIPEAESVEGMVEKYSALPEVEYAEPNYTFSIQHQK